MKDKGKTKKQLINELIGLRKRVDELVKAEAECNWAKEALQESAKRYRLLFEHSPIGIGLSSSDGIVVSANKAMETITGYSHEELKKINLEDTYENIEDRKALFKAIKQYGAAVNHPARLKRKDGSPYDALLTLWRTHNSGGEILFQTICIDITDLKQAEKALQESEEKYRALTENSPDLIMRFDRQHRYLYVNPAVTTMYRMEPDDLIGKTHRELGFTEDMCLYWEDNIQKVFDTGLPRKEVFEFEGKASHKIFDWQLVPEFGTDGSVETVMCTARDIAYHKQVEQALKERGKELEIKTNNLEEANTALRVLLKKRNEDKTELEEKVLFNVRELLMPYFEKLKKCTLDERQIAYIGILESNLNDIISPFSRRLSSWYLKFTPAEMQIANLVKHGKTSKEIAELLNLSSQTIDSHRKSIRKKLGIKNRKANLRTHLLPLE